jgi:hypothetical protein
LVPLWARILRAHHVVVPRDSPSAPDSGEATAEASDVHGPVQTAIVWTGIASTPVPDTSRPDLFEQLGDK